MHPHQREAIIHNSCKWRRISLSVPVLLCPVFTAVCGTALVGSGCSIKKYSGTTLLYKNKPAAQAAGADPFRCIANNRQNPQILKNWYWNQYYNFYILYFLECPKPMPHIIFYDRKHHFKPFGLNRAIKLWEGNGHPLSLGLVLL